MWRLRTVDTARTACYRRQSTELDGEHSLTWHWLRGDAPQAPRIDHDPHGALTISLDYFDELGELEISENAPPQQIIEVVELKCRGWVIVDAELDVFLMTKAEYNENVALQ